MSKKDLIIGWMKIQGDTIMEVQRVKLGGFRNISEATISFDAITSLVGLNGYGKSNVIDAIDFGIDFINSPNVEKTNMMAAKPCVPILKKNVGQDYSFDITLTLVSREQRFFVNYGFSFAWRTAKNPEQIKTEYLNIKNDGKNQKYNSFIQRKGNVARFKSAETGRCDRPIAIDSNALVLNKLAAWDDLFYLDIIWQLNSLQFFVERHLDANQPFVPESNLITRKDSSDLDPGQIQNIPKAISVIKQEYPEKFELLKNAFLELFPNIIDVNVREIEINRNGLPELPEDFPLVYADYLYALYIMDNKLAQPIRFEQLSDGTKRVFLMLTVAVIAEIKNIPLIAIEEPENSIHPGLFRNYLDILNQLCGSSRILITSHSPYIIQYLNPTSIYLGLSAQEGTVQFRKIASSKITTLYKDANEYSNSMGDYLFELMSSPDSEEELRGYIEKNGR